MCTSPTPKTFLWPTTLKYLCRTTILKIFLCDSHFKKNLCGYMKTLINFPSCFWTQKYKRYYKEHQQHCNVRVYSIPCYIMKCKLANMNIPLTDYLHIIVQNFFQCNQVKWLRNYSKVAVADLRVHNFTDIQYYLDSIHYCDLFLTILIVIKFDYCLTLVCVTVQLCALACVQLMCREQPIMLLFLSIMLCCNMLLKFIYYAQEQVFC